jgi:hypothetical protein
MRMRFLLEITSDDGTISQAAEVAAFEKVMERPEDLDFRSLRERRCSRPLNARSSTSRSSHGQTDIAVARRVASAGAARAVIRSSYDSLRRRTTLKPATPPLPMPEYKRSRHRVAAAQFDPRSCRSGATLS